MTWLLKIKGYAIALGSFLLALIGTYLWAKHSGKDQGEANQQAADAKATADAMKDQLDTRAKVELEVNDLPKPKFTITTPADLPGSDAQTVGTADPTTAAGKLSKDWSREG